MKLITNIGRRYKNKEYLKSIVIIPNKVLKELGWKKSQELKCQIREKKLMIEKR